MSGPLAVAFFDRELELHGALREGASVLFERRTARSIPGAEIEGTPGGTVSARVPGEVELTLEPAAEPLSVGGASTWVCTVSGTASGRQLHCLGVVEEPRRPPDGAALELIRTLTAVFDGANAVVAVAERDAGSPGHGHELVRAAMLTEGEQLPVEDARISTVYDRDGRQLTAGLELWLPAAEYPHRAFGTVLAGTTLELPGASVNVAAFGWRMEGREGAGLYELALAGEQEPAAA